MTLDIKKAQNIAETFDVSTDLNGAVVYSVSYLPTTKNRDDAYAFVKENKAFKTLDDTPCGKVLCALQEKCDKAEKQALIPVWKTASERFIAQAKGDLKAFVTGADFRSTFCTVEIPAIKKNANIKTINGTDKFLFLENFA